MPAALPGFVTVSYLIADGRATTLLCQRPNGPLELRARVFVLAGGAYGSPTILMRSGIGPAEGLAALGITPALDRPGVGRNLHEHPGVSTSYTPSEEGRRALERDLADGRSFFSQVILRACSQEPNRRFDLHVLSIQAPSADAGWAFDLYACAMAPRSRGHVLLQSTDARELPHIETGFLTDDEDHDLTALIAGVRLLHRLSTCPPLAKLIEPAEPLALDEQLVNWIRQKVGGYGHPVGTCAMGTASDPRAVVDANGKVHGLSNTFIADASIVPTIPRANTNLTCFLIGFRVADAIIRHVSG